MTDVMVYWKDYRPEQREHMDGPFYWHSNSPALRDLLPGDRLWVVTSGKSLNQEPEQAGFLIAVWCVQQVVTNPGDNPAFPKRKYGYRIIGDVAESITLDVPVNVDHVIRSDQFDESIAVGRFLRGPRRLDERKVRALRAAAGPSLAHNWLTGMRKTMRT